ncbi:MAG: UxaA family hydrolase [Paracoccaceae bacterium]
MTPTQTDPRLLLLAPSDNVFVLRGAIEAGETIAVAGSQARVPVRLGLGHKIAAKSIAAGEKLIKYGAPIGVATRDIASGDHVHLHNIRSDYTPTHSLTEARAAFDAAQGDRKS